VFFFLSGLSAGSRLQLPHALGSRAWSRRLLTHFASRVFFRRIVHSSLFPVRGEEAIREIIFLVSEFRTGASRRPAYLFCLN